MKRNFKPHHVHQLRYEFHCNLCGIACVSVSRYRRFCHSCRVQSDVYRYSEWFGNTPVSARAAL